MSIVQKIIVWFLGLTLVPTLLIGGILYFGFRHYIVDQSVTKLEYQADVQQRRVEDIVKQNKTQLAGFTSRVLLPTTLDRYNHSKHPEDLALLTSTITTSKAQTPKYRDITILSLEGKVVASTMQSVVGQDYAHKNYFKEAATRNNSTDYLFTDAAGQPHINLVGPILYHKNAIGIIVIDASAEDLQSVVTDYSGLGNTGETTLARREANGNALYVAPLRFDKTALLSRTADGHKTSQPIFQAINGFARTFSNATNYQGKSVIAAVRPIKGTHWGMTVEVERAEMYQPLYNLRDTFLLLTFVILVFSVFVALYAARLITDPLITMSIAAAALSKGDLSQRVHQVRSNNGDNEFGILAHTFNIMAGNLEKLDKMKTEFILLTSHQLRTPASAVKGFLALLLDGTTEPLSAKQKDLLQSAYEENEQQLRLINQILSISQAESHQIQLSRTEVDLVKMTKKIAKQLHAIALEHKQKITVNVSEKSIVALVDSEKMHMVIENLISNAMKYSPDETEIIASLENATNEVIVRVKDQGYGIDPHDMDQLFKKFSRLPNPKSVKAQGSGLGLYLVKQLVELHEGTIEAKSAPGLGATFIVRLPKK
ncbi:MAG TPA: sensor histidine kinase [Candidatus Saccharimonadales bacterium]|nr:sensor histidine kinase [Candidatus Saccharimonadales bacterium]